MLNRAPSSSPTSRVARQVLAICLSSSGARRLGFRLTLTRPDAHLEALSTTMLPLSGRLMEAPRTESPVSRDEPRAHESSASSGPRPPAPSPNQLMKVPCSVAAERGPNEQTARQSGAGRAAGEGLLPCPGGAGRIGRVEGATWPGDTAGRVGTCSGADCGVMGSAHERKAQLSERDARSTRSRRGASSEAVLGEQPRDGLGRGGGLESTERSTTTLTVLEVSAKHMPEQPAPAAAVRRVGLALVWADHGQRQLIARRWGRGESAGLL